MDVIVQELIGRGDNDIVRASVSPEPAENKRLHEAVIKFMYLFLK